MSEGEFKNLIKKRGCVKQKLTHFRKYFEPLHGRFVTNVQLENKEIIELRIRTEKLQSLDDEFEIIQNQIEMLCDDDQIDNQYHEREIFTNDIFDLLARAKEILNKYSQDDDSSGDSRHSGDNSNNVNAEANNSLHSNIKLPFIKCPTFNCEFGKWLEFKDTFEALFHNNSSLSDIQKFHYLRSCLEEEALKIIQSLEFAAHNYNDAWGLLCDRFDNSRLLVNNHLKALFEIENLSRESSLGLRTLIDSVNKHLRALKTLELPTENWDALIIYMISLKLDKNTNREWEQSRTDKSLPALNDVQNAISEKQQPPIPENNELFNGSSVMRKKNVVKCNNESYVLLSTATIYVKDKLGKFHEVCALLDSGSQCSFISEKLSKSLGVPIDQIDISVCGINNITSKLNSKCQVTIKSIINDFQIDLNCIVVPKISDTLPSHRIDISNLSFPSGIQLANPVFNEPKAIDILIGADLFWHILLGERINLGKNKPTLVNTVFGYIVSGLFRTSNTKQITCNFIVNDDLQKFWSIEEIQAESLKLSTEDLICEEYFSKTVSRDISGKFVVRFPLKCSYTELGDSRELAIKRLISQEKKLKYNNVLKNKFNSFMQEYNDLQHMRKLSNDLITSFKCFLPFFAVVREESLTTEVRIVFDASAKTSSGVSLNDIQYTGPAIQNDIFKILLRFREHKFVVIADIAKMYRQILIHPDERFLQNVVWRANPYEDLSIYELQTVTYGTSSAPYLAIKCIKKLASDNRDEFPEACKIIDRDMYVDDLITGFNTEEKGIDTCNDIAKILKSASFYLRKWVSNSATILKGLQDTSDTFSILELGDNDRVKTLGIQWLSHLDLLSYKILDTPSNKLITKRILPSSIAKIYDPLGLLSPCIILVKILIQKLWSQNLEWDEILPSEISKIWECFQSQLHILNELKIPRLVVCDQPVSIEIHGFSDASMTAYCGVIYLRTMNSCGKIYVRLLCSKTKVAPTKSLTIPRLELCGALTLARLVKQVSDSLTCNVDTFYWCDSQIVLNWLNTDANKLQVFVSNRVAEIQRISDITKWSYVNTKENPADIGSRGMFPKDLCRSNMWWDGPGFLYGKAHWPRTFDFIQYNELPELKGTCNVLNNITSKNCLSIFEKFSSLNKLIRVVAYCKRFITCLKTRKKEIGPLTVSELENSMQSLIKLAQMESFGIEISQIRNETNFNNKHKLLSLSPFLDPNDLLRVGGRLKNSSLSYDEKHQILLDGRHKFTKMIFQAEHLRLHHASPQLLLFSVRQKFWATSGMNVAKMIVRTCIRCFRNKPKPINTIMANFPRHRVHISKPFTITGIDYAGPVNLRDRKTRPYKTYKAYICLFICFATKCIHIELVTDLTSGAFIAAFRRFASRRGFPNHLYSDNGSTFVGAYKELKKLYEFLEKSHEEFCSYFAKEQIVWHYIPPYSPHFGGIWESNVKAIKFHLYRVIGESLLTFEEYSTLLAQIEATLNSRPLHQMSSDPNDLTPLTPSHLLIGQPLTTLPDPMFEDDLKISRLSRFQLIQQINQSFWKRWSVFYLLDLQKRNKWKLGQSNVKVGELVVVRQDKLPPTKWILGRITEVHPGDDGRVRVVTLKTPYGIYKRAISKICPLPHPDNDKDIF